MADIFGSWWGKHLMQLPWDSGCSKTVCGRVWSENYRICLPEKDAQKVHETKSKSTSALKFSGGNCVKYFKKVLLPVAIGKVPITIVTEVVAVDIHFLLSKDSIKATRTTINFSADKFMKLDQSIRLIFTSSRRYAVLIAKTERDPNSNIVIVLLVDGFSRGKKGNPLKRLIYNSDITEVKKWLHW